MYLLLLLTKHIYSFLYPQYGPGEALDEWFSNELNAKKKKIKVDISDAGMGFFAEITK